MSSILQPESISQVLGSLLSDNSLGARQARQSSEPDLEDFELISEDELEKESPWILKKVEHSEIRQIHNKNLIAVFVLKPMVNEKYRKDATFEHKQFYYGGGRR